MPTASPPTAEQWAALVLDLETERAACDKAVQRIAWDRNKLLLDAAIGGDKKADARAAAMLADQGKRQQESDDLGVKLEGAKAHLAEAQEAEHMIEVVGWANDLEAMLGGHVGHAERVDEILGQLAEALQAWRESSNDLQRGSHGYAPSGSAWRRNNPTRNTAAFYRHGLDKFFATNWPGAKLAAANPTFADCDARYRNQIESAIIAMRQRAGDYLTEGGEVSTGRTNPPAAREPQEAGAAA